jgi:hypothetical protein
MSRIMTAWSRVESEIFDDALADEQPIRKAARLAGRTPADGVKRFEQICAKYGWQAK